ncbi:exported hypothetical protein [Xanthomonas citri pv. citri]|nr:hypothetical protein Xazr_21195 [Xanthomonas campestris pv. azadirachtae]CEE60340.1 exported hypothetical protein [Xanthomonas citri pv. citri]
MKSPALPLLLAVLLAAPAAHALDAAQWRAVAPAIQAAIECRAKPDTAAAAWAALPRDEEGGIKPITPPLPFAVFGLPVREVSIFIDPAGELGESYTAKIDATPAAVRKAARFTTEAGKTAGIGGLTLTEDRLTWLTCTVQGEYDESDFAPEN